MFLILKATLQNETAEIDNPAGVFCLAQDTLPKTLKWIQEQKDIRELILEGPDLWGLLNSAFLPLSTEEKQFYDQNGFVVVALSQEIIDHGIYPVEEEVFNTYQSPRKFEWYCFYADQVYVLMEGDYPEWETRVAAMMKHEIEVVIREYPLSWQDARSIVTKSGSYTALCCLFDNNIDESTAVKNALKEAAAYENTLLNRYDLFRLKYFIETALADQPEEMQCSI